MTPRYIYLAAPYSAGDQVANIHEAILAGERLTKSGLIPFIPHLTGFWHFLVQHDYEFWLSYDDAWLTRCDALVRLPGPSVGADREVARALELGIPVYTSIEALEAELRMAKAAIAGKGA